MIEGDGEGSVQFAGKEGEGRGVDEAIHGLDEGPSKDGVNRDILSQCNTEVDRAAIREEMGELVGDDGAEQTRLDSVGNVRRVRIDHGAGEADWFKGL